MKIGFYYFATDYGMPLVEVAQALEERGYESLFVPEHTHIPASRRSPWPGGPELPKWYYDTYDQFLALSAAAVVTKTIKLGTAVYVLALRHPLIAAR